MPSRLSADADGEQSSWRRAYQHANDWNQGDDLPESHKGEEQASEHVDRALFETDNLERAVRWWSVCALDFRRSLLDMPIWVLMPNSLNAGLDQLGAVDTVLTLSEHGDGTSQRIRTLGTALQSVQVIYSKEYSGEEEDTEGCMSSQSKEEVGMLFLAGS